MSKQEELEDLQYENHLLSVELLNLRDKIKTLEQERIEMVNNLREVIPLHEGNQFEEGYHHALDQVRYYGKTDEVKHTTIS